MKKLCVLQILPSLNLGGVERGTIDVALYLQAKGIPNHVCSAGGLYVDTLNQVSIPHLTAPVNAYAPWRVIESIIKLYRYIKKHNITVVHVRSRIPAWSAYYAAKWAGIPIVSTIHGAYRQTNVFKRFFTRQMMRVNKIIAVSQYIAKYIQTHFPNQAKKVIIIMRGIDMSSFQKQCVKKVQVETLYKKWGCNLAKKQLIFPARLTRLKGHLFLLQALTIKTLAQRNDWECIIVGNGAKNSSYLHEIKSYIQKHNLAEKVFLMEAEKDMPAVYSAASVILSCSTKPEAFGRTIAEAGAMGVPVIASNHGGAREIIKDNQTGLLYDPQSPDDLAEKILTILTMDEKTYKQMSEAAENHIKRHFTLEKMCQKTLTIYREVSA